MPGRKTPPSRVAVTLLEPQVRLCKERATRQAMERDYRGRGDSWGRGLCDPRPGMTTEQVGPFVGLLGEMATATFLNRQFRSQVADVDLAPNEAGDGGVDLVVLGVPIQVKTRTGDHATSLVRCRRDDGASVPLLSRIHVFAQVERMREHCPILLGWAWTEDVIARESVPARRGSHFNHEVPDADLMDVMLLPATLIETGDYT
jgi:hypothetical protein